MPSFLQRLRSLYHRAVGATREHDPDAHSLYAQSFQLG